MAKAPDLAATPRASEPCFAFHEHSTEDRRAPAADAATTIVH
jgi:hypothetical protein